MTFRDFRGRPILSMRPLFANCIVTLFAVTLCACDTAPGVDDASRSAPQVSNLVLTPGIVLLDNLAPGSVVDGIAHITVGVSLTARDDDGDIDRLYIIVQSPFGDQEPLSSTEHSVPENGRAEINLDLSIPSAEIGAYAVRVYASDRTGRLGNQVIGTLMVAATGAPPTIDQIDMPERITRPAQGQPAIQIPIVAHVSDPDGLANILYVETIVNGTTLLRLCDDGAATTCNAGFPDSGDVTAGDGLFTLTISLSSANALGDNRFEFRAIDRSGLESAPVTRTITVE